jgi:release factor glutamine methyltransferase
MDIKKAIKFGEEALLSVIKDKREVNSNINFLLSYLLRKSKTKKDKNINNKNASKNITNLILNNYELTKEEKNIFINWIERRLTLEPVQYITEETEFFSIPIKIKNGVLIPRQDSETLVEEVLKSVVKESYFLDICAGSGCLGIAILKNLKNSKAVFVDKYKTPISLINKNLKILNLEKRANVICSNMFSKVSGKFDFIVSNPPYIKKEELKSLAIDITMFEPEEALLAGNDGLCFHKILAKEAMNFLKDDSYIFIEIGHNQGAELLKIFKKEKWGNIEIIKDLSNNDRVLKAKKSSKISKKM